MNTLFIKEVSYCTCNTVYLCKSSYSEETYHYAEYCKYFCQPFELLAHSVFNIIKRSSDNMSVLFNDSVLYSQKTFRILCCGSYYCCHPHPKQCSGSSGNYGRSYTYNISCSDCGRESCTKCRKA